MPEKNFSPQSTSKSRRKPFVPSWVREILADLKGAPVSVWIAYLSHADKDGLAWPSNKSLARTTGYSETTVKKAKKYLIARGLLCADGQSRNGGKFGRKKFRAVTEGKKLDHGTEGKFTEGKKMDVDQMDVDKVAQEGSPSKGSPIRLGEAEPSTEPREKEGSASPRRGAPAPRSDSVKAKGYSEVTYA
jgi:DNA-binding transcriptional MocR family regulator